VNSNHEELRFDHARLARIKKEYDPDGLFCVHNSLGSEAWSNNGFTRR